MPTIDLTQADSDRLQLVAATLGLSPGDTVGVLLDRLQQSVAQSPVATDGLVPIHVVYQGTRVEAEFDRSTGAITVLSQPLTGRQFNSPSRAAIEVVRSLNPNVKPNRNGWGFWIVTATGQPLQSLR